MTELGKALVNFKPSVTATNETTQFTFLKEIISQEKARTEKAELVSDEYRAELLERSRNTERRVDEDRAEIFTGNEAKRELERVAQKQKAFKETFGSKDLTSINIEAFNLVKDDKDKNLASFFE